MANTPLQISTQAQLRQKAELSLRSGSAPPTQGWTIGAASLTLLHRLASDPVTASDALKLLHELQVHQVELDLQHEHMMEERQALEQSTLRMMEMYVFAPLAYFLVNPTGQIVEANLVGARMLGVKRGDADRHNICRLADPGGRAALLALLARVHSSSARHNCRIQALDTEKTRYLEVIANACPTGQNCLVMLVDVDTKTTALPALLE